MSGSSPTPDLLIGCVVMASGMGRRFGGNKLTADFLGGPMIQRVLAATEGMFRRRIVVTPGLGEQGGKEADVNFALGTVMADCADSVILVGRRAFSRSIIRGMLQSGFSRSNIHTADDMDDATEILEEISDDGDTVLFESRIPEYEEEE